MSDIISDGLLLNDGSKVYVIPPVATSTVIGGIKADAITTDTVETYSGDVYINDSGNLKVKDYTDELANKFSLEAGNTLTEALNDTNTVVNTIEPIVTNLNTALTVNTTGKTITPDNGYSLDIQAATSSVKGGILADEADDKYTGEVRILNSGYLRVKEYDDEISKKANQSDFESLKSTVKDLDTTIDSESIAGLYNIYNATRLNTNTNTLYLNTGYHAEYLPQFSESEVCTYQKWTDGKYIYMMSIATKNSISVGKNKSVTIGNISRNFDYIVDIRSIFKKNTPAYIAGPYVWKDDDPVRVAVAGATTSSNTIGDIVITAGSDGYSGYVTATIYYTLLG